MAPFSKIVVDNWLPAVPKKLLISPLPFLQKVGLKSNSQNENNLSKKCREIALSFAAKGNVYLNPFTEQAFPLSQRGEEAGNGLRLGCRYRRGKQKMCLLCFWWFRL